MPNRPWTYLLLSALLLLAACSSPTGTDPLDGASLYSQSCASCHGTDGAGRNGPSFANNSNLADTDTTIDLILTGSNGMPAFANQLSDTEIAAVLTHIRTSWGNTFDPVYAQDIALRRAAR